jgi:predicted CoA-substrate-specific enzyme activase
MVYDAGIDIGSVSIHCIVIDENQQIVYEHPGTRHFGCVVPAAESLLEHLITVVPASQFRSLTFTGLHGKPLSETYGAHYEVDTITQVLGAVHVVPGVRSIISIGGQTAMLIQLAHRNGTWQIEHYNCNNPCASGTGSFIDQQAERLCTAMPGNDTGHNQEKIDATLQAFIRLGSSFTRPAPVACRCTVFTKSDMIHLQNKGESLANIIAGLHYSNATNFISTLASGKTLDDPAIFTGGVASNNLQLTALKTAYPHLFVPNHHASLCALGAALQAQKMNWRNTFKPAAIGVSHNNPGTVPRAEPLKIIRSCISPAPLSKLPQHSRPEPCEVYLGIDIGSTTTKYTLVDSSNTIMLKSYTPTAGKPVEVTRRLLNGLSRQLNGTLRINGIATTGSGRHVAGAFCSAELVTDEITAHARAAFEIDPAVDTIFEIGGQDSKYIHIRDGAFRDFAMNKVCAAGTGSFLHELARKLNINIVNEFQEIALAAKHPVALNDRCTVFMESELLSYLKQGVPCADLVAGLCYAIVRNYLNRVVGTRPVGDRILFMGGTALNKGITAAFENILDCALTVPPHCEVRGAYGAALILKDKMQNQKSAICHRDLKHITGSGITFREISCNANKECTSKCRLKVYDFGNRRCTWGGECGKYEIFSNAQQTYTNFFSMRQKRFRGCLEPMSTCPESNSKASCSSNVPTVGIPIALHGLEWGILWCSIMAELGYPVIVSPETDITTALRGVEKISAETCFPVKVFAGHVQYLADHADYLFLPSLVDEPATSSCERGLYCPMVTGSSYISKAILNIPGTRLINPVLFLNSTLEEQAAAITAALPDKRRHSRRQVEKALEHGWHQHNSFKQELIEQGRQFLDGIQPGGQVWIVTGRPYNLYDERCNLHTGSLLHKLGIRALPYEFLDLSDERLDDFPGMYWGTGSRILRAARRIARTPGFHGVHISNFACGLDSFIEHFYRYILRDKSPLILELDEHNAEGGILTRLEAYREMVDG